MQRDVGGILLLAAEAATRGRLDHPDSGLIAGEGVLEGAEHVVRALHRALHHEHLVLEPGDHPRSEEHTSELQSPCNLVCRLLLEKKKQQPNERDDTEKPHDESRQYASCTPPPCVKSALRMKTGGQSDTQPNPHLPSRSNARCTNA